ncbi:DNA repair protein Dds20/Mei5 [Colletotrichum scovillei]|uniref:DNA repair protein Dds20/Mei5 n=1 Tax=Colletotrichum scovillei TaxID=1209932 RepID=A0A9P7QWV5_9PEZI|nr:DNA repair protein Dds20/Mei5 [Colletotrichum scovillei]KAF4784022.1 DNA repair protein Dds20/Mei5 [Colletotrichum scovillei]KAG7044657.1 DNA repair protein Dds20/Mei5 [Colletotrichum scovillei]KAG7049367.1 DNA repair protein Dds20/Mei5 [Colletotrichum scovillei]KAG7064111.1 DNA repair protein Dds20/Mei5 [Colletotrichum scovillei]
MLTPAAKRRRVDAANETLRKPFRSPLVQRDRGRDQDPGRGPGPERTREVSTADAAAVENPAAGGNDDCDSAAAATTDPAAASSPSSARGAATTTPRHATEKFATPGKRGVSGTFTSTSTATATPTRRPFSVPRARGMQLTGASPSPLRTTTAGPYGGAGARKTGPGLGFVGGGSKSEREAEGREEILRQAERIRGPVGEGETDEELVELIGKWRAASRIAAEEVFEGSKERVKGMGGLKAWRRARREDEVRFMAMLEGEESAGRARRGGCEEWEGSDEGYRGEGGEGDDGEGEDEEEEEEEFTMGTMLRSMNIDFEIIGYDEDTGWWRDG